MRFLLTLIFCALLSSCGPSAYHGTTWGADEFVIDSYQIQEGKFAVLQMEGKDVLEFSSDLLKEYPDTIQEGDVLEIVVYGHPSTELFSQINKKGFLVSEGKIHLPHVGAVGVEGKSLLALQNIVQEHYEKSMVWITYKERPLSRVELAGLVEFSSITVDGKRRLFEVLSLAKISPTANLFKSYVVRKNQLLPVDLYKLLKEGNMKQNIVMQPGDKIYIAEASAASVIVLGEVTRPVVIDLPKGFMTIKQALGEAGGIPYTANKNSIQVIRGNLVNPKIYNLNWRHIVELPSDHMLLMPGDIVYVAAAPITQWNRFVSQVLPTLVGIKLFTKHTQGVGITLP